VSREQLFAAFFFAVFLFLLYQLYLFVAAFFVVVRRLSRQQVREALVSTATPLSGPSRMDGGA